MVWMIVSVILLIAAAALGWLWMQSRTTAQDAQQATSNAAAETAAKAKEVQALQRKVAELEALTFLPVFTAQSVYKLLAKEEIEIAGGIKTHGMVQMETGAFKPFVVSESMAHLDVQDCFSPLRGQLAKLEPEAFRVGATPLPAPGAVDDDATVAGTEMRAVQEVIQATGSLDLPADDAAADDDGGDKTVMFSPDRHKPQITVDPHAGLPYLKAVAGDDEGTLFHLPFGEASIGREKTNTVALSDTGSSRVHCKVAFSNHHFVLRDNNSTNGTLCNGEQITEKVLEFGDTVRVADTEMIFTCKGDELKDEDPDGAIAAFEATLKRAPDFLTALKVLAFLLERNIVREKEAAPLWSKIMELEKSAG